MGIDDQVTQPYPGYGSCSLRFGRSRKDIVMYINSPGGISLRRPRHLRHDAVDRSGRQP